MNYLLVDQDNQTLRLSLDEARQFLPPYDYYLLEIYHEENSTSGTYLCQVPVVVNETQRITTLQITTESLLLTGLYRFKVYGQSSPTNINPNDASVVGVCEIGLMVLTDNTGYFNLPNISIDNDVIYNG